MSNLVSIPSQTDNTKVQTIRVLIVDDRRVVRDRIKEVISSQPNIEVVGTAEDAEKAIAMVRSLRPNFVLMDIEMPGMNGIEATAILIQKFSKLNILIISSHDREEYVREAIEVGADGYILKHTSASNLIAAIQTVQVGGTYFEKSLLQKIQQSSKANCDQENRLQTATRPENTQDVGQIARANNSLSKLDTENNLLSEPDKINSEENLSEAEAEEFLPPIEKWMSWGAIAVITTIALIVPLCSILKYKTKVKVPATVRPDGNVRLVQAGTEGSVTKILAKPGDKIDRGDIIATVDPFRIQSEKSKAEQAISQQKLQLAQLSLQIGAIDRQIIAETQRNNSQILAAEAELSGNRRTYEDSNVEADDRVKEAQAQLKATEATLAAAKNKLVRYRSVAAEGALAKEQLAEAKLEVDRQQQELEMGRAKLNTALAVLNPSDAEVEMARQNIQQLKKSKLATDASLNREKKALIQQRIEAQKQLKQEEAELRRINKELEQTKIKATTTGVISKLELRNPGELVQMGEEIAQIIPDQGTLMINTIVPPQDIGKIEAGQNVQMRVSACIYTDYGVLNGKIHKIAKDVTQTEPSAHSSGNPTSQQSTAQSNGGFYEVTATPEASTFGKQEFQCNLQTGMQGSAEIITREETALRFILRKARLISNM